MNKLKKLVISIALLVCVCTLVLSIIKVNVSIEKLLFLDRQIYENYPKISQIEVEENYDLQLYLKDTEVGLLLLRDFLMLGLVIVGVLITIDVVLNLIQLKRKKQETSTKAVEGKTA